MHTVVYDMTGYGRWGIGGVDVSQCVTPDSQVMNAEWVDG